MGKHSRMVLGSRRWSWTPSAMDPAAASLTGLLGTGRGEMIADELPRETPLLPNTASPEKFRSRPPSRVIPQTMQRGVASRGCIGARTGRTASLPPHGGGRGSPISPKNINQYVQTVQPQTS